MFAGGKPAEATGTQRRGRWGPRPMMQVVAALLQGADGRVLLARRPEHKAHGGLWEFPGGKLEAGESLQQALARELMEELGIRIAVAQPWQRIDRRELCLHVLQVRQWQGQPSGMEGQAVEWFEPAELYQLAQSGGMPPADRLVAESLYAPLLAITPEASLCKPPAAHALQRLAALGVRRLLLRPGSEAGGFTARVLHLWLEQSRAAGLEAIVHQRLFPLVPDWSGPVHLTQQGLEAGRVVRQPFSASCHDPASLARASEAGARFVLLSPVEATASHPDIKPLGWQRFQQWLRDYPLPVYALGGLGPVALATARQHGAVGVAGIRAFWPGFRH